MMFYPGQKVVCVNDGFGHLVEDLVHGVDILYNLDGLTKGHIYTIRAYRKVHNSWYNNPHDCVDLYEIVRGVAMNLLTNRVEEYGFLATRFRPLQTKETDISIFKRMLTDADIYERV